MTHKQHMNKLELFRLYHEGKGILMNNTHAPSFNVAMNELKSDKGKQGHWSWYIFPTNKGSRQFGNMFKLTNSEAKEYIANKYLRNHYIQFMSTVSTQLDKGMHPRDLLMSNVDVRKTFNSATLFKKISGGNDDDDIRKVTTKIITQLEPYMTKLDKKNRQMSFLKNIRKKKNNDVM